MMRWREFVVAIACVGCGGEANDGERSGHCYPNGTCNVGLQCSAGICVASDAAVADAPVDAIIVPADAVFDAPVDALMCNADALYEPNDQIQTAFVTGVATQVATKTFSNLILCPAGDHDYFHVAITTANTNLEMVIDFDGSAMSRQGSILNAGGVPIANASLVSGMPQRRRAYTPNLPVGNYYAHIYAELGIVTGYELTLTVTGP
jgi:hypothetical protein